MHSFLRRTCTSFFGLALMGCLALGAQAPKVALRWQPAPDQKIQMSVTQKMDLEVTADGPLPAGFPVPLPLPMKFAGSMDMSMLQNVGKANEKGTYSVEATMKPPQMAFTMNGLALPMPKPAGAEAETRFSYTLDRDGKIIEMGNLAAGAPPNLQELMTKFMPKGELEEGVPVVTPIDTEIPLPIPGAAPLKLSGQVTMKLVSVEGKGAARTATVDVIMTGRLVVDVSVKQPEGNEKTTIWTEITVDAKGTVRMHPERGIMRDMNTDLVLGGTLKLGLPGVKDPIPTIRLKGNIHMTANGTAQ